MFWSVAIILGYFFAGIARFAEDLNARPMNRPVQNPFQLLYGLFFWPRYVPTPWMALTIHVAIVAAVLSGLGYVVGDLLVRAGIVAGLLVVVFIAHLRRGNGR